jgi:branched-chain amino acid transport system permease protein
MTGIGSRAAWFRRWALPLLLFIGLALLPIAARWGAEGYIISLMTRVMILAIAAVSLDLILGVAGLVSFGHAAFLGIGAYWAAILITEGYGETLVALPVALVACGGFAAVTGWISLRTKGVAFIMITLAFGQMAFFVAQSLYAYGGDDGLTLYERSTILGTRLFENKTAYYYVVLIALVGVYALTRAIVASRFGRVLRGARENATRVSIVGFDVMRVRLTAYVISGMLCGLAGFLFANHTEFVSPAYLSWQRSGELIFMVILGGMGTLHGAIVGALGFLLMEEWLAGLTEHWKVIFGPLLILIVLFTRGGLVGLIDRIFPRRGA